MITVWVVALAWAGSPERIDRLVGKGELEKALKLCEKAGLEANESCAAAHFAWLQQSDAGVEDVAAWRALLARYPGTVGAGAAKEELAAHRIAAAALADLPRVIAEWKGTDAAAAAIEAEYQRADRAGKSAASYQFVVNYPDAPQRAAALASAEAQAWKEAEAQNTIQAWNALTKLSPPHPRAKEAEALIDVLERATFLANMKVVVQDAAGLHTLAEGTPLTLQGAATVRVKGNADAALSIAVRVGGQDLGPEAVPAALAAAGFPAGLLPAAPTWVSGDPRTLLLDTTWCQPAAGAQSVIAVAQGEWRVEYLLVPATACTELAKTAKPEGSVILAGKPLAFGSGRAEAQKRLPALQRAEAGADWSRVLGTPQARGEWSELNAEDVALLYFRDLLVAAQFSCGGDACYNEKSAYNKGRWSGAEAYRVYLDGETTEVWGAKGAVVAHDRQWLSSESGDPFFTATVFESRIAALAGGHPAAVPAPQTPPPTGASPAEIWGLVASFKAAAASKDPRRLVPLVGFPLNVEGTNYASADALVAQLGAPTLYDSFVLADLKNYRSMQDIQIDPSPSGPTTVTLIVPAGGCQTILVLAKLQGQLKIVSISVGTWE